MKAMLSSSRLLKQQEESSEMQPESLLGCAQNPTHRAYFASDMLSLRAET